MATIGIDLDGVCYDFTAALCDFLGRDVPSELGWDFYQEWGWDRRKFLQQCRKGIIEGSLFGFDYLIPGAREGVQALLEAGHDLVFVTARSNFGGNDVHLEKVQNRTLWWIKNKLGVQHPKVIFSADKARVARDGRIDYFLDDKPENVDDLRKVGVKAYLFDQPWNREHLTVRRVKSWEEFTNQVFVDRLALSEAFAQNAVAVPVHVFQDLNIDKGETRTVSASGGEKGVKPERYDLLPKPALDALSRIYAYGATKYDDHNWRRGYEWSKSYAAAQRHLTAFWDGQTYDEESGLPHVAHAMFHMAALLTWLQEDGEGGRYDDRYRAEDDAA